MRSAAVAARVSVALLLIGCGHGELELGLLDAPPSPSDEGCSLQPVDRLPDVEAVIDRSRLRGAVGNATFSVSLGSDPEDQWVHAIQGATEGEELVALTAAVRDALRFPDPAQDSGAAGDPPPEGEDPEEEDDSTSHRFRLEVGADSELFVRIAPGVHCRPLLLNRNELSAEANQLGRGQYRGSGRFRLLLFVSESGVPLEVRVHDAADREVAEPRLRALGGRARFHPARVDVVPVPVWFSLPLNFRVVRD